MDEKLEASVKAPLPRNTNTILPYKYDPELDLLPACDGNYANYYQNLIGILIQDVELFRIDICVKVSDIWRYLAAPWAGHLEKVVHIYAYIKSYEWSKCVYEDATLKQGVLNDNFYDWSDFYL